MTGRDLTDSGLYDLAFPARLAARKNQNTIAPKCRGIKVTKKRSNTRIESVSVAGATARIAPIGLQIFAADFLAGAKAIPPPDVPFAPTQPYLVCHALELALKAFLSLKGYPLDNLAGGKFGHDLESLLDEAKRNGLDDFVKLEEDQKFQIVRASNYYASKAFEYPAVFELMRGNPEMPNTNILIDITETLVAALREPCIKAD